MFNVMVWDRTLREWVIYWKNLNGREAYTRENELRDMGFIACVEMIPTARP